MANSSKCGCNYTATKRISKTASITSISNTQRATRFNVWSNINLITLVFLMTQLLAISQVDAATLRTRQLKKRHSIFNAAANWENPCLGTYVGPASGDHVQRKTAMKILYKDTLDEFLTLNATRERGINISDIQMWLKHNLTYKFLPKLQVRVNSSVALKRWYRNLQTFVAAFYYLQSTQADFDKVKPPVDKSISRDLRELMNSARKTLCEIEAAINNTSPASREKKFISLSLEAMNKRLKLRTKQHIGDNHYQVDPIDLKFVKSYYLNFLESMLTIMEYNKNKIYNGNNNLSSGDNTNSNSRSTSSSEIRKVQRRRPGAKKRSQSQPPKRHNRRKPRQKKISSNSVA